MNKQLKGINAMNRTSALRVFAAIFVFGTLTLATTASAKLTYYASTCGGNPTVCTCNKGDTFTNAAGTVCEHDDGALVAKQPEVVPAQAEKWVNLNSSRFLKIDSLSPNHAYMKIILTDVLVSSKACESNKGTLVDFKGTKYCQTGKSGTVPSTQRK